MKRIILLLSVMVFVEANDLEIAKKMLPQSNIKNVAKSEIEGLLSVLLDNNQVIYLYPAKNLMFFGEIWTTEGKSISSLHREKLGAKKEVINVEDVLKEFAINIKKSNNFTKYGLMVFTDPNCPYCNKLQDEILKHNFEINYVFMPLKEGSYQASLDIIKSNLNLNEQKAKEFLNKQSNFANQSGIAGTPFTIVYDIKTKNLITTIAGADIQKIQDLLKDANETK